MTTHDVIFFHHIICDKNKNQISQYINNLRKNIFENKKNINNIVSLPTVFFFFFGGNQFHFLFYFIYRIFGFPLVIASEFRSSGMS